jgi:hypothetical protein
MGVMQELFDKSWKEHFNYDVACATVFRRIVKAKGLTLDEEQIEFLVKAIASAPTERTHEKLDVPGLAEDIVISQQDFDSALADFSSDLDDLAGSLVESLLETLPGDVLGSLYTDAPNALQHRHEQEAAFRERLGFRFKDGLDHLEMLIMIAQESGNMYLEDLRKEADDEAWPVDGMSMLDALVALHARACRIACEILCLLKCGFADGASARWRSLHEIAVTAMFLLENGGDTPQRYLDHAAIERRKTASEYQEHCKTLGWEPYTPEEEAEFEADANGVIDKYGIAFKGDFGWAAAALNLKKPTFTNVEKSLQMSHWRPHYRQACGNVHAGSHILHSSLAMPDGDDVLLAGPSDAGLCDPACNTARSLMLASVAFFTFRPNLDSLIVCKCLESLCEDVDIAFEVDVSAEDKMTP